MFTDPYSLRLGIIGAGTMGAGIALAALMKDMFVTLYDVSPEMLEQARGYITQHLERKERGMNLKRLELTRDLERMAGAAVVIEAVPERLDLKQELFAQLDHICPPPAILATNTSTLAVTAIAAATDSPERAAGMHFFNPAPVLPLVEVIRGARTSTHTVDALVSLAKLMGKTPVVVQDTPGFIVNRVARPFYGEALRLLGENTASHEMIDLLARLGAGFKMGPFQLMDLIGIDINAAAMQSMYEQTFGEPRYRPHPIQARMVQQKALGRKTGQGFYSYKDDAAADADPKPPRPKKSGGTIAFIPGEWAPGLQDDLEESGLRFIDPGREPTFDLSPVTMAVVCSGSQDDLLQRLIALERRLDPETPIITQCADITLAEIASHMEHPRRMVGFDGLFFAGSQVVSLVSLPGQSSSSRSAAERLFSYLGRLTVWIEDSPALVLPRIVCMLANEAAFAAGEQVADLGAIDQAMKLGVNYPRGPLEWAESIGYAKVTAVLDHLHAEYHEDRYRTAPLLRRWARIGRST
jgi:3-hydroxybutyryl-CoA dehydrogenase